MGWGLLYPADQVEDGDQLVICYLTINRDIVLTRVMYEPPGGFYPVVLMPVGGKIANKKVENMIIG